MIYGKHTLALDLHDPHFNWALKAQFKCKQCNEWSSPAQQRCQRPENILLQVIKRFIMHAKKTAFIVEHDFIMAAYLADRVIVYEGEASVNATARAPQSLLTGQ